MGNLASAGQRDDRYHRASGACEGWLSFLDESADYMGEVAARISIFIRSLLPIILSKDLALAVEVHGRFWHQPDMPGRSDDVR
jgi:hypothetical protein